jgi:hypothetical protein
MAKSHDPVALEILKIARELVINEYTDKRAQDHNKWLANSDVAWKSNRIRLPYPDIPPYPTEKEIVSRAQVLMNFIHKNYEEALNTPESVRPQDSVIIEEPEALATEEKEQVVVDSEIKLEPQIIEEKEKTPKGVLQSFFRKTNS